MNLSHNSFSLKVKNLKDSIHFYNDLGFKLLHEDQDTGEAKLTNNELVLSLYQETLFMKVFYQLDNLFKSRMNLSLESR